MSDFVAVGQISPTQDTRLGRMLSAGRLTATAKFKVGGEYVNEGEHITVSFSSRLRNKETKRTEKSSFADASNVYVSMGDGGYGAQYLGCFYPRSGKFFPQQGADKARIAAALFILRAATDGNQDRDKVAIQESERCGRCARELTDPVSIARGLGPECAGKETGSKHQEARPVVAAPDADPVPARGPEAPRQPINPAQLPGTFEQLQAAL